MSLRKILLTVGLVLWIGVMESRLSASCVPAAMSPSGMQAEQIAQQETAVDELAPDADQEDDVAEEAAAEDPLPELPPRQQPEIDPQQIQLELWDGSKISGKVGIETIGIQTDFGRLDVPVRRIRKILPGLQSYPELKAKIDKLVEGLADKDFDVREQSQRELVDMGLLLRNMVSQWSDKDISSAEQKKRLAEVSKDINAMADEFVAGMFGGEGSDVRMLTPADKIITDTFTIVGRIEPQQYLLRTKFGELTVTLADIKTGDRTVFGDAETIRKAVKVGAEAFFQRTPVKTGIRINRGDRISIRASGTVQWTNWNQVSTPEGLPGQGQMQGINSGTLIARIGESGKFIKVGQKADLVASATGILYLGIAVQDNYANQGSYRWTGGYDAKVMVEPR